MWMKGYGDAGEIYLPTTTTSNNDSFSGSRKLRPLIPRPPPPPPHLVPNPTTNPPNNHHHHHARGVPNADHFLALNHHLATAEQSKGEFNTVQQAAVSSRWNPTQEQLRTLEDLWRQGTRTPSADEIQQITSRLRQYGKIEGKNVFYWFQNHKARERQKRRRQMESGGFPDEEHDLLNHHCETGNLGHKEAGGSSKTASEGVRRSNNDDNNNNWEPVVEKEGKFAGGRGGLGSASSAAAAPASSSAVMSPWMKNLNDNSSSARGSLSNSPNTTIFSISGSCCCDDNVVNVPDEWRNAAWHHLTATPPGSFSSSSSCLPLPMSAGHLIMMVPPETTASCSPSPASSSLLPSQEFQTLQLFPLRSCCDGEENYLKGLGGRRDDCDNVRRGVTEFAGNGHVDHHQFFEFLPLKN